MNSFRIRCTTCRSKLRIKDPSLAGHILSCPKCGSMVLVPDPEGPDPENQLVREADDSAPRRSRSAKRPADPTPIKFGESDGLFEDAVAMLSELDDSPPEPAQTAAAKTSPAKTAPAKKEPAPPKIAETKDARRKDGERKQADSQPEAPAAGQPRRQESADPSEPLKLPKRPSKRPQPEALPGDPAEPSDPTEIGQPQPPQPVRSHRKAAAAAAAAIIPPVVEPPPTAAEGPRGEESPSADSPGKPSATGEPDAVEPAPAQPADMAPIHPQAFAPQAGMGVWRIAAISAGVATVASVLAVVTIQSFLGSPAPDTARNVADTELPGPPLADDAGQPADTDPGDAAAPVDDGSPNDDTVAQFEPKEKDPVETSDRDGRDDEDADPEAPAAGTPEAEGPPSDLAPSAPAAPRSGAAETAAADSRPAGPQDPNPFLFDPQADEPAAEGATDAGDDQQEDTRPPSMRFREDPLYDVFGESFPVFDNEMLEATASLPEMLDGDDPLDAADPQQRPERMLPPVDVEARLADPIAQIQYDNIPLVRFLRFVSNLTNMPISISPEALVYADITPTTAVSVDLQDTNVEKMLTSILSPHGLGLTKTDRGVRIDLPGTLDGQYRTTRLACNDLASNDKELAELAYLLVNLAEPASWKTAGGEGQYRLDGQRIIVSQSESALFSSILLLERLRVARGISPRSSFSKRLFRLEPRRQQIDPQLQQTVTAKFVVPTPLEQLVAHLERQAGVTILCDWESLATDGVSPEALASLSAPQVPLEDALDSLCQELDIRWRPTIGGDIQLTGSQDFDRTPFVEFYPIKDLVQSRSAAAALIKRAESQLDDLKRHKAGRILYDPKSGHLLARLTQADHDRLVDFLKDQSR